MTISDFRGFKKNLPLEPMFVCIEPSVSADLTHLQMTPSLTLGVWPQSCAELDHGLHLDLDLGTTPLSRLNSDGLEIKIFKF